MADRERRPEPAAWLRCEFCHQLGCRNPLVPAPPSPSMDPQRLRELAAEQARATWEAWMVRTGRHSPGCYLSDTQLELFEAWKAALSQIGAAPLPRDETAMVDAAMAEMSNIHPPLRRSECARLIRAAHGVAGSTYDPAGFPSSLADGGVEGRKP